MIKGRHSFTRDRVLGDLPLFHANESCSSSLYTLNATKKLLSLHTAAVNILSHIHVRTMRLIDSEDDELTSQSSTQDLSVLTASMMTIRRFKDCVHDYSESYFYRHYFITRTDHVLRH